MTSLQSARLRRLSRLGTAAAALVLAVSVLASACSSSSSAPLPIEVAEQLDVPNNAIADLTEAGDEEVPRIDLMQAAIRAQGVGTKLRFVVAGADDALVSAESVVSRYGGTVISYKANDSAFEAASHDMSGSQLDRALTAAGEQGDMGASAAAFVGVLEEEGLEGPGTSFARWLLLAALLVAAIFMLVQAYSFWKARKRRIKRQRVFADRKAVLRDWATQLEPQVAALAPHRSVANESQKLAIRESQEFVGSIVAKIDDASTLSDLDAAEMRIGRVAIKLRDLRRSLGA